MKKVIIGLGLLCVYQMGNAQEAIKELPGKPELVSSEQTLAKLAAAEKGDYKYTVEDYFKKPAQSEFQLSPNGNYLSYRQRDTNGKRHVFIKDINTKKTTLVLKETEDLIRYYGWANNNRLLYIKDNAGDENHHLFAVDIDGENNKELTPFKGVKVMFKSELPDQEDYIIILMNKTNPQIFEPFKINIKTGALEKLFENTDMFNPVDEYYFDKNGDLKAYSRKEQVTEKVLYYRSSKDAPFEKVIQTNWNQNFYMLDFDHTGKYPNGAYMISTLETNTNEVVLYDLKEKRVIKKMFHDSTFDVSSWRYSKKRNYEIDFFYYNGEKQVYVPVSETYKKMHKRFTSEFPDKEYQITSVTKNEDKYLLYITSDKLYGTYYFYDLQKDTIEELFDLMPQLKPVEMAEMRPIKFKSRDGLDIYGYLTIPKDSKDKKVPLIVNPHGGPYGPRDLWRFNPETQLFASRGYATLQINYRGSGGYGKKFFTAGFKQIGRKMLDDLEDGVAYAKSLGFIDETKVAIYGGSYGGWAALGGLVKTPDLYTCAVDYVGVSNLFTVFKSFPVYWKPYLKQMYEMMYDPENPEEVEIMKAISPALNAEKITKPLFVVQGANDPRVNIDESDQIVENLRKRNFDVPYMVKYNEGHGFSHEENQIHFYKTMMGFFAQNLK